VWKQRRLKVAGAAAAAAAAAAREGEGGVLAASAAIAAAVAELDATLVSTQVRRQQLGLGAINGTSGNGNGASPVGGAAPVRVPCELLAVVKRSSCSGGSSSSY
jgi:NAD(P)H-hydrate repair Nnr-like enzyme with NAD(P)H-hydrate dehydratase domain